MQLDFKARVSHVICFTLNLLEEIHDSPEEVDSEECRSTILTLLDGFDDNLPDPITVQSVRYALTAWVDDLFSRTPWPHSAYWNVHLLEQELFGTNCRQWRFFEQAEAALHREDWTALSVFQLCVECGFRGIYTKNRMRVQLNDLLPMVRSRSSSVPHRIPELSGVLNAETNGVCSVVESETESNPGIEVSKMEGGDLPSPAPNSTSVLPSTLAEWCQTTFWPLGHRNDKSWTESQPFALFRQTFSYNRVLTEWMIVMAIGVLLCAVLVSLGF